MYDVTSFVEGACDGIFEGEYVVKKLSVGRIFTSSRWRVGDSASELNSTENAFASSSLGVTRMDKPKMNKALLNKRELNHRSFPHFVSLPNSCSNAFMFQSKYTYLTGFYLASRVQLGVGEWPPTGRATNSDHTAVVLLC